MIKPKEEEEEYFKQEIAYVRETIGAFKKFPQYQALNKRPWCKLRRRRPPSPFYIGKIPRLRNHPSSLYKALSTANKDIQVQGVLGNQW